MTVLWIVNIPFPPLCDYMGWRTPVIGGWLYSCFKQLLKQEDIHLSVASPYSCGNELIDVNIDGVRYFAIPYKYKKTTKTHGSVNYADKLPITFGAILSVILLLLSDNTRRLDLEETKAKIVSLEYIQNELNGIPNLV